MPSNYRTRLFTVFIALASLLFMQLAVAGYVCSGTGPKVDQAMAMAEVSMPCAESMTLNMDETQPNLCQAHCQAGHQTADKYELQFPNAIAALPADFALSVRVPVLSGTPLQAPHLMRTTAPSVAIRHCCLRL